MFAAFRRHPILVTAFAASTLAAAAFLGLFLWRAIYWEAHENEPIRPWMTVGYVGRSWDLNPREIDKVAGLPVPEKGKPLTLAEIAADRGVPVEEIIAGVEAAIAELRAREGRGE